MLHKNKKGFTLIELLAVIVILAIIALIATPIILNMLEDSKKSSAKVGATHYIDTLEKELMYEDLKQDINPKGMYLLKKDGTYEVNGEVKKLSIKGKLPSSGTLCVDEKGLVESYSVVLDGYVVTKTGEEQEIEKGTVQKSITCNVAEEIVQIKIPENSNICSQTKEVVINYPHYEATVKEYSLDRKQWLEYKEPVIMKENGTLYARLRDKRNNKVSSVATMSFTTIDNEAVDTTAPSLMLSEEKPTSEINVTFKQTDNCGLKEKLEDNLIEEEKKKYGISEIKDGEYTWQEESVFKELKNNTTYYIKTRANDIANNGILESDISEITTKDFGNCNIEISNYGTWTPSKTATITGETTAGTILQYRIYEGSTKEDTDWIDITNSKKITLDAMATEEEPTTVYCRYVEKNEKEEIINTLDPAVSSSVTTIDTTEPNLALGSVTTTTKSITIPISTNSDNESEIKSTTCKLGTTSGSYTINGTISNNTCTATNLTNNVTYYYQVVTTNNAGLSTTKTGSTKTEQFAGITITPSSTTWTTSKTVTITGSTTGAELQYRVVSGTTEKVAWTKYNSAITIDWEATLSTPTVIYARFSDGTNYSEETSLEITTIDRTAPSVPALNNSSGGSWTNKNVVITVSATDAASGIASLAYSYDKSTWKSDWDNNGAYTNIENGKKTTGTWSGARNNTTYFRACDNAGNCSSYSQTNIKIDKTAPGTASSTIRIGSASGTVRANTTAWTNQTLWWGGFSASDTGGSGVSYYQYSTNCTGTASATLSSSYTYSSNTNYTFCIRAVDTAGNAGAWSGAYYIKIDKTPPTCSVSGGTNNWIASSQKITGTCSDAGGSSCKSANVSATYSKSSGYYDSYYSPGTVYDNAGNSVTCGNARVRVTGTTLSDYVTGSKVFMYDGKTGLSGTRWTDQSGNGIHGTLIGATISGNSVYLNGTTSSYVRIAQLNYPAVTMEMVFKPSVVSKFQQLMSNIAQGGYALEITADNALGSSVYKNGAYRWAGAYSVSTANKIYYGAARMNSSYQWATLNSTNTYTSYSGNIATTQDATYMILGGNPWTNYSDEAGAAFKGYIYAARMYSRVLSEDELYKNYVIDRARFGF